MERDGVCYFCAFWIRLYEENKNNPNWLIIDGESWIANPFVPNTNHKTRRFMGMGGRIMEAISNDGRKIISNDWWHQGKIPGQIVTEKGRDRAEIVYEDDLCNAYPFEGNEYLLGTAENPEK